VQGQWRAAPGIGSVVEIALECLRIQLIMAALGNVIDAPRKQHLS
jgi:hypothetical protein